MAHIEKFQASALGAMLGHYERKAEIENGYRRDNIDPTRTHLNFNLHENGNLDALDFINQRIESLNLKRAVRKDAVKMIDTIVTLPQGYTGDVREFMQAVKETLDGIYGKENCIAAWVHMDEAQPHMHYASVPVTADGRLSAKDLLTRAFMKAFHPRLEKGVCEHLGIERAGLLLTDEERQSRAGKYVGLAEFKSAHLAVENLTKEIEEKEEQLFQVTNEVAMQDAKREKLQTDIEDLTKKATHVKTTLDSLQERFDTLLRHVAEIADAMKLRPWPGKWRDKLESLLDNPIAKNALIAGQPWQWESDYKRAEKSIKKDVKEANYSLNEIYKETSAASKALPENQSPNKENRSSWER